MAVDLAYRIEVDATQAKGELRATQTEIDKTSQAAKKAGESITDFEKRMDKGFAEAEKSAAALEKQIDKLGKTKDTTNTKAGALTSTLMRFAGPAALGLAIRSASNYADRLEELSVQTGMTIAALQKFDHAAKLNGSNLEAVTRAASTFQDRLAGGDKSVVRALNQLGISYDVIRSKTPDQQMFELARAVTAIEDPATRANVAIDLFGRSGAALIPTLKAIVENMGHMPVTTEDSVKQFGQLSDALVRLKDAGLGFITTVLAPIGPLFTIAATAAEKAAAIFGRTLAVAIGPIGMLNDYIKQLKDAGIYDLTAPTVGGANPFEAIIKGGKTPDAGQFQDILDLFGTDKLSGYTSEIERQLNEQLREQTRLHDARGKAAEEASKKATKAAADELAAYNALIGANRQLVADAQAALGEDFNLFFGRGFSDRGGLVQGQSYFGSGGFYLPSTSLAGVSGTMPGLQSGGNIANWIYGQGGQGDGQSGMSSQQRWMQQWQRQYGDYSSFGEGAVSVGNALQDYGPAIDQISRGDTEVLRATNIRGRGARAKAGLAAGAAEGGKYGGPYGAIGGAVIGAIIGAARNPMFEDQMNRIAFNYDRRGISEDLARQIELVTKEKFEKNRSAGEIYSLSGILGETGLDSKNIKQMTARLRDAFSMREDGAFSEDDLKHTLDTSFGYYADYYNKIGGLADKSFTEIIALQRRFGVESEVVTKYVEEQTSKAVTGLGTFLENATVKSSEAATGLMGAAVALFEELKKGPEGLKGAVEQLAPIIAAVDQALQDTGTEASVTFGDMRNLLSTMANEDVQRAVTAVGGLGDTMVGLNNAVLLNEETYRGLARAVADTRNELVAQGHDGEHVNRLMQEDLQTIWELQQDQKYAVDDVTQALLDEATAQGLVGERFRDTNQQMVHALQSIDQTLQDIRDSLLGVTPAAEQMADGVTNAIDRIPRNVEIDVVANYTPPDVQPHEGAYGAVGGYVGPHGIQYLASGGRILGFRPRGSDTVPAMLTPGEGVLSRRGMDALGRLNRGESMGDSVTIEKGAIVVNGVDDPEAVADAVLRKLTQRRKYSRYRGRAA